MWEFLNTDRWTMLGKAPRGCRDAVVPLQHTPKYEAMMPKIVAMADTDSRRVTWRYPSVTQFVEGCRVVFALSTNSASPHSLG
jgi:hypothetical protein